MVFFPWDLLRGCRSGSVNNSIEVHLWHGAPYVCSGHNFTGDVWEESACGFYDIGNDGWSDRLRSSCNNQTGGVQSIFMQWDGESGEELGRANAGTEDNDAVTLYATDGV